MFLRHLLIAAVAFLSACSGATNSNATQDPKPDNRSSTPLEPSVSNDAPLDAPAPGTSGGLPDDKTPLAEPKGPIDPKSAEGAGQVMQLYGGLLEQRRFGEARKLWGSAASSGKEFAEQFADYSEIHTQVGKPGGMEGAAGSSYVTVPFVVYGRLKSGRQFNRSGTATLRRVNDVPGATAEQLRWHIAQIEFGSTG